MRVFALLVRLELVFVPDDPRLLVLDVGVTCIVDGGGTNGKIELRIDPGDRRSSIFAGFGVRSVDGRIDRIPEIRHQVVDEVEALAQPGKSFRLQQGLSEIRRQLQVF